MSTLYELTADFQRILAVADDPDIDPQVITDTLEAIEGEFDWKAEQYGKVIRELESRVLVLKAEEKRLKDRRTAAETNISRMKQSLQEAMIATNKRKIPTDLFTFSIRRNPASVVMDEQYIENIPDAYLIPQEPKLDRAKLRDDLKAGIAPEGIAHLEYSESLMIR